MAVVIAFVANVLVAIAKTAAAGVTGSAALAAEAIHSWADAGNEVFLLIADRRGRRERDEAHPLGYGRDVYVWSLFAAVGVFTVGAVLSVVHGIQGLLEPEPVASYPIGYLVLGVAFLIEGGSLVQSVRQARREAGQRRRETLEYVVNGSNTTLRAVVAEDSAALVGLLIAALALFAHQVTGAPAWDAAGSIAIGLLLGVTALLLIDRNRRFIVGMSPPAEVRRRALERLRAHPGIERVTALHLEYVGPGALFVVAAVDLVGDDREDSVAARLRAIEHQLESAPAIRTAVLTLAVSDEPDLEA
ncbi:cation diffusion facilitator family transporter [Homoserinibacter sp. YIM 151385]|uniref:cation diffusion facilitator family transporter n=1 Tax=Homoserinibacter sp. YIM 151385 TaxID=2985506 RepID=UPI0022F08EAE|nr:cation transporter [Homoserinibacter sp. YIM 151385]WBU38004.1 cation transporter [Homoserinibacter sp. YIM 151385]